MVNEEEFSVSKNKDSCNLKANSRKENTIMKKLVCIILTAVLLLLCACDTPTPPAESSGENTNGSEAKQPSEEKVIVSVSDLDKLKSGMTYGEVVAIFGQYHYPLVGASDLLYYVWEVEDGREVAITFEYIGGKDAYEKFLGELYLAEDLSDAEKTARKNEWITENTRVLEFKISAIPET